MSRLPVLVACLFAVAALAPGVHGQAEGPVPVSLPLTPETDRFWISQAQDEPTFKSSCTKPITAPYGDSVPSVALYATNNIDDPCRKLEWDLNEPAGTSMSTNTETFTIYLMPAAEALMMDPEEQISGKFWLYSENVGRMVPSVRVMAGDTEVGSWKAEAADPMVLDSGSPGGVGVDTVTGQRSGFQYHPYEFSMDAPANVSAPLRLLITLAMPAVSASDPAGAAGRFDKLTLTRWGIVVAEEDMVGWIDLPLTATVAPSEPEMITCPDGTEVEEGTDCPDVVEEETPDDNNTTEEDPGTTPVDTSNNTTAPQDENNTADTSEKKGLPGFGLVAVLVAGFVGAAVLRRRDLQVRR